MSLLGQEAEPLPGAPPALRRRALALLAARGIRWLGSRVAVAVTPGRIAFERGDAMDFDACLVATGAAAPQWPGRSGLAVDAGGFIRVGPSLRSVSHGQVFAAGDVAAYADARPKSGVFAVRAGAVLAGNLRAACRGRRLRDWHPQRHALALISTADGRALASWAGWSAYGRWVWHWKDGIDRRFVARFDG